MGCIHSRTPAEEDQKRKNDEIEAQIAKDKVEASKEVKLLLLGAGESGKSTIVKQMKIIHLQGYKENECAAFKEIIYSNTIQSMKVLIAATSKLNISIVKDENKQRAHRIEELSPNGDVWNTSIGEDIDNLWHDDGIQATFKRANEFQLNDSASYYFNEIERINNNEYLPTQQDVLRSRVRTTGIVETKFSYSDMKFKMFDVGGQRNERKKWIHCFQGVTAVIFCVGLSEYDQKLFEDNTQNRMVESMLLFDEICNSRWFVDTDIILFLNKTDIFKEKLKKKDLSVCFPDYKGGQNYDNACKFVLEKFLSLNKDPNKKLVYSHYTCATDTENIRVVFNIVCDIILRRILAEQGFAY